MNRIFFEGKNFAALCEAVDCFRDDRRDRGIPALVLIDGRAGLGKTEACQVYTSRPQNRSVYLRAKENWTPRWMLAELARELGFEARGRVAQIFEDIIAKLRKTPRALFFDEADLMARKLNLLETIRDIYDEAAVPVVLVGMDEIGKKLARHEQFCSRIGRTVTFQALDAEEIQRLALTWCAIELDDLAAKELHKVSGEGDFRLVITNLAEVERRARLDAKPGDKLRANRKEIETVGLETARARRVA